MKLLWKTGRIIILDSGFCVLKGIVELSKKGLYVAALIKKRRYWPWGVPGDAIDEAMQGSNVGEMTVIKGMLDNEEYYIMNLKEPDYISKVMTNYGTLGKDEANDRSKTS